MNRFTLADPTFMFIGFPSAYSIGIHLSQYASVCFSALSKQTFSGEINLCLGLEIFVVCEMSKKQITTLKERTKVKVAVFC